MILLSEKTKDRLKSNWGDSMYAMECMALLRVETSKDKSGVFILAMNPDDEDEVFVLYEQICPIPPEITSFRDLCECFDDEGEYTYLDEEYRPRRAKELFLRLGGQCDR